MSSMMSAGRWAFSSSSDGLWAPFLTAEPPPEDDDEEDGDEDPPFCCVSRSCFRNFARRF
jgi:hypothetical protein